MPEHNVVHHTIGRLIGGRITSMKTRADAVPYCDAFRSAVHGLSGKAVIFADYRKVTVFSPDVADELQTLMRDMNPHVERSAIVVAPEHSTHQLQVERVVREAHFASRRRFSDVDEACRWLAEVLSDPERRELERFARS